MPTYRHLKDKHELPHRNLGGFHLNFAQDCVVTIGFCDLRKQTIGLIVAALVVSGSIWAILLATYKETDDTGATIHN